MQLKGSTVAKHTRLGLRIPHTPHVKRKEEKHHRVSQLLRRLREQKEHKFKGSLGTVMIPISKLKIKRREELKRKNVTKKFCE